MNKILVLAAPMLVLAGSVAAAPGLNLGWNLACPTTLFSAADMGDPCNDNANAYWLIGSARAPAGLTKVSAETITVDIEENAVLLSPWWHLEDDTYGPPGCRGSNGQVNPVGSLQLSALFAGASTTVCKDYWKTSASGGAYPGPQIYYPGYGGPARARIQITFARTAAGAGPLTADTQYYVLNAILDTQHAIPDPTDPTVYVCAGCQDPVCLVFTSCKFLQPPGTPNGDYEITTQDVRQSVTWQGGSGTSCPVATPTRHATWGRVKSLYR